MDVSTCSEHHEMKTLDFRKAQNDDMERLGYSGFEIQGNNYPSHKSLAGRHQIGILLWNQKECLLPLHHSEIHIVWFSWFVTCLILIFDFRALLFVGRCRSSNSINIIWYCASTFLTKQYNKSTKSASSGQQLQTTRTLCWKMPTDVRQKSKHRLGS